MKKRRKYFAKRKKTTLYRLPGARSFVERNHFIALSGCGRNRSSEEANIIYSNGYKIEKITNPTKGEGDVDGIIQGGDRNNCYAWAMTERDGFLYIGTNRNILGGMIAQFAQAMTQAGLTYDQVWDIVNVITNGEVPAFFRTGKQADDHSRKTLLPVKQR